MQPIPRPDAVRLGKDGGGNEPAVWSATVQILSFVPDMQRPPAKAGTEPTKTSFSPLCAVMLALIGIFLSAYSLWALARIQQDVGEFMRKWDRDYKDMLRDIERLKNS
jgi:hypothetical protein